MHYFVLIKYKKNIYDFVTFPHEKGMKGKKINS